MMNRCGSTNTHQYGPSMGSKCSCNNSFSYYSCTLNDVHHHECCSTTNSTTVDCTLSLGTPSTRHSEHINSSSENKNKKWSGSSFMSTICNWGNNKHHQQQPQQSSVVVNDFVNGDPLLARRCANCDTTSTPLWRNGPRGPKSLCNACGIRYKKEERRATAAANVSSNVGAHAQGIIDSQHLISSTYQYHHHPYNWAHGGSSGTPITSNEFTFGDQYHGDESSGSSGVSFLSWHLSVPERSGLVQYDYS
ncbi:hypothetical protein Sjap_016923 [Stephania japonica]|uniref:GATA-type domain-containing protein n=1 Tax=Stephania japonica TaxID=461633 RepID=A0AAP0NIT5_9MAGN